VRFTGNDSQFARGRLHSLAARIDALADKDRDLIRRTREILDMRLRAAAELHALCAAFVASLNGLLAHVVVSLDPPGFSESAFRDSSPNLFQIAASGRMIEIEFESTPELLSTEDFRVPYTIEGSVRAFNQAMLERNLIEEHLLFYTVERGGNMWRYFDARTHRSDRVGDEYLMSMLEKLV
jgi:hypothetical protein